MSCEFAHDDGAYVLGSLSPGERLDFERHLPDCDECARSVRALAGLPGLLDRVDPAVLEHPSPDPAVPSALLSSLTGEVVRARRRRTLAIAGLAATVATIAALSAPMVASRMDDSPSGSTGSSAPTSSTNDDVETRAMSPLGDVPVEATLGLEQVRWGTRMLLTCTYEPQSVEYELPAEVDYLLFVRTRDGRSEQVGSWRSVGGTTMQVPAATSVVRADIAAVEVRTVDGRVVLRLHA
jgi:hypothetical protein